MNQRKTQRQRILDRLLAARGGEVPSFELSRISLQYGARVKELREAGFRIINRVEHHDGKAFGFFHLELGPPTSSPPPSPTKRPEDGTPAEGAISRTARPDQQPSLFADGGR